MREKWAFNTTYRIAPLRALQDGYTDSNTSENLSFTYALRWVTSSPPRGFYLDSTTGEMLVEIPNQIGNHTAQVVAERPETTPAVVYSMSLEFLPADTTDLSNGLGGRDCAGGAKRVDVEEFDSKYTCECPIDTIEPNCDILTVATAASSSSDSQISILTLLHSCGWPDGTAARRRCGDEDPSLPCQSQARART